MSSHPAFFRLGAALLTTLSLLACTDTELRCIAEPCQPVVAKVVDNIVAAKGRVCTVDPASRTYPYKVIVVIDNSYSNNFSDPMVLRAKAAADLFKKYAQTPDVYFALISFGMTPKDNIPGFTNDLPTLLNAVQSNIMNPANPPGWNTNYTDTLKLIETVITKDLENADTSTRLYSMYEIQWLSDGNPEGPSVDDHRIRCDPALTSLKSVEEATARVDSLPSRLRFRALTLYTIYLTGIYGQSGLCRTSGPALGLGMADDWGADGPAYLKMMVTKTTPPGSYQALSAQELKFDIHPTTVTASFKQNSFYLANYSRVVQKDEALPDSDTDGIGDAAEDTATKTNKLKVDTSGSGCSDIVFQTVDAVNPGDCVKLCGGAVTTVPGLDNFKPKGDEDQDTLLSCEEVALKTSDKKSDTDEDGWLDVEEVRFGTAANFKFRPDDDHDSDGITDFDEIKLGLDPLTPQSDRALAYEYQPLVLDPQPTDKPNTLCYTFQVNNVRLVETLATDSSAAGDNKICLTMLQQTSDNPGAQPTVSRACTTANYRVVDGVVHKTPADGTVTFKPEDFKEVICAGGKCNANVGVGTTPATPANPAKPAATTP